MNNNFGKTLIEVENLWKSFPVGQQSVEVLKNITLRVKKGEFLIIFGPSGCGKSTLLHTILGLEKPLKGKVKLFGRDLYSFSTDERAEIRKKNIGMVYQQSNWIKSLKVAENVVFPLILLGEEREEALKKASKGLKMVGMEEWADYYPMELSSGQQQKVSLVRALLNNPQILIADEPTGNLDRQSGDELMSLLARLNQDGKTIIMVTHDLEYLKFAARILKMLDGKIEKEYKRNKEKKEIESLGKRGKKYGEI